MEKYLYVWLLIINLITFVAFGLDKAKAVKRKYRIKEATLMTLSLFGGALGGIVGMYAFHHKTKKPLFKLGVPLILLAWVVAFAAFYFKLLPIC